MLIAIVGLNGSGKDTAAKYLKDTHGFEWVSLSDIVRNEVRARGLDPGNRDNLNLVSETLRKEEGPDYLAKRALKNYSSKKKLVLSSFRHPTEIDRVKEANGFVVLVDVNLETRFKRTAERVRKNPLDHGSLSFEDFKAKEERELSNPDKDKMQILEVLKKIEFKVDNSSSVEELYSQLDSLLLKLSKLGQQ